MNVPEIQDRLREQNERLMTLRAQLNALTDQLLGEAKDSAEGSAGTSLQNKGSIGVTVDMLLFNSQLITYCFGSVNRLSEFVNGSQPALAMAQEVKGYKI